MCLFFNYQHARGTLTETLRHADSSDTITPHPPTHPPTTTTTYPPPPPAVPSPGDSQGIPVFSYRFTGHASVNHWSYKVSSMSTMGATFVLKQTFPDSCRFSNDHQMQPSIQFCATVSSLPASSTPREF